MKLHRYTDTHHVYEITSRSDMIIAIEKNNCILKIGRRPFDDFTVSVFAF